MPRTKASQSRKRKKKSTNTSEQCQVVDPAILIEVADVRLQFQARMDAIMEKRDHLIAAVNRTFDIAMMKMAPSEDFKICWDQEENDENGTHQDSFFDATVSTSIVSPELLSVTNSSMGQSEGRISRSQNLPTRTPAPRSNSASTSQMKSPRTLRRSSRSCDLGTMPPPRIPNRFCTPATHMVPDGSRYNTITPKVLPNSSVSVLRRPRGGEMAFAMSGSPLMVASNQGDEICNVNLALGDGRVLSILPTALRPRELPEMSEDTMDQLFQLRNNLDMILSNKPGTKYH